MPPRAPPAAAVKWEWETDDGTFQGYATKDQTKMEKVFQENGCKGVVHITFNGSKYEMNFDAFTQKNLESGKIRRVKRTGGATAVATAPVEPTPAPVAAVAAPPVVSYVAPPVAPAPAPVPAAPAAVPPATTWSWADDSGNLKPYGPTESIQIEAAYLAAVAGHIDPVSITVGPYAYSFDFVALTQTNTKSGKSRAILRSGDAATSAAFAAAIAAHAKSKTMIAGKSAASGAAAFGEPAFKKSAAEDAGGYKSAAAPSGAAKSYMSGGTKVIKKGNGIVDPLSGMADKAHVYEEGPVVWQCMLNQTNVGLNNNKYYVIQLLELDAGSKWFVFTRWGRVGSTGQSSLDTAFGIDGAKSQFCSKFRDKTKNDWNYVSKNKDAFVKHDGKYHLMDIDMGPDEEDDKVDHIGNATAAGSALHPSVQRLLKMIGSKGDMEKAMKELEIDTAKMPLGKISKKQIKDAFGELKELEAEIKKASPSTAKLIQYTSNFYTLIPHDFGMMHPPIIQDTDHVKRKMELLEMLAGIEVAAKIISESKKTGKHALDASYESMHCEITPLSPTTEEYQRIQRYVENTHGKTHHLKVIIEEVFVINRAGEQTRYATNYGSMPNKMMLWHGSRTMNYMGILSQGLRIAPPEAPSTGYMFGKGVYFADAVTKSANYCHSPNEGLLILCEVALGNTLDLTAAKYMDKPPSGKDSTVGVGRMVPCGGEVDADGVKWPTGKLVDGPATSTALLYNEFIVYDVSQLKMRYLLKCKFGKK